MMAKPKLCPCAKATKSLTQHARNGLAPAHSSQLHTVGISETVGRGADGQCLTRTTFNRMVALTKRRLSNTSQLVTGRDGNIYLVSGRAAWADVCLCW